MSALHVICCFGLLTSSLMAMENMQVHEQADEANRTAYLEWLKNKALEGKNFQSMCHLLPKFLNDESSKSLYDLCEAALALNVNAARQAFESLGIDQLLYRRAYTGDCQAAYLFGLIMHDVNKELAGSFFKAACGDEPRAYVRLIEQTEDVSELIELADSLREVVEQIGTEKEYVAKLLKERFYKSFQEGNVSVCASLLDWYALTDEQPEFVKNIFDVVAQKKYQVCLVAMPEMLTDYLTKCAKLDADVACHIGEAAWRVSELDCISSGIIRGYRKSPSECLFFWSIAQKKSHVRASWMLLARDPHLEKNEQRLKTLRIAVAAARSAQKIP